MAQALKYNPERRIFIVMAILAMLFLSVMARLVYLQVVRHTYYNAVAEEQRKRAAELQPHRGTIYVSEGLDHELFPVASNTKTYIAYAIPRNMDNPDQTAAELAPELYKFRQRGDQHEQDILNVTGQTWQQQLLAAIAPKDQPTPTPTPEPIPDDQAIQQLQQELAEKFDRHTDPYAPFLKPYETLDGELKTFLDSKKYQGIVLEEDERRTYPEGSLLAHVLGYVGFDGQGSTGQYGIEGFFDSTLKGNLGFLSGERAANGSIIGAANNTFSAAEDGSDITLTIDRVVQSIIEKELATGVQKYGATRGSVVVMNPKTGAVLGMATYPTFDPNTYYAVDDPRVQSNPVVSDSFEPGSILKPVIMAAGLNESIVKPNTTFVDGGPVHIGKFTINTFDGKHHGVQTMTNILEQSNNVGMVWLSQQVGSQTMYDYLRRFGFGERTGIELQGETQTNIKDPGLWGETQTATSSFGQGITVTPIQALNGINAIANGGVLTQPRIVDTLTTNGQAKNEPPVDVRQVVKPQTATAVADMMVSVIENGVGRSARVPGYYMAGKTGTAQVAGPDGKYSTTNKIISFVGFGPVEDPKFSILIKLDNPAGLSFASGTSAPMFHTIAQQLLTYYQVPPSYDVTKPQPKWYVPDPAQ